MTTSSYSQRETSKLGWERTEPRRLKRNQSLPSIYGTSFSDDDEIPCYNSQIKNSRYKEDFIELEKIGKGGFGSVYKVKNCLDGKTYAIKKIVFNKDKNNIISEQQTLREVKTLARLEHPNILRYYQAWLEEQTVHAVGSPTHDEDSSSSGSFIDSRSSLMSSRSHLKKSPYKKNSRRKTISNVPLRNSTHFPITSSRYSPTSPEKMIEFPDFNKELEEQVIASLKETSELSSPHASGQYGYWMARQNSDSFEIQWERDGDTTPDIESPEESYSFQSTRNVVHSISLDSGSEISENWNQIREKIKAELQPKHSVILYIQTQLCSSETLKDRLQDRNCITDYNLKRLKQRSSNSLLVESTSSLSENEEDTNNEEDWKRSRMKIFLQICKGVKYIHDQGIIHRDLKPSNIFLMENDHVVIGDFGLAVELHRHNVANDGIVFANGTLYKNQNQYELLDQGHTRGVGTYSYSSPEQINNHYYDEKTDIYSLGIIFFELFYQYGTQMERVQTLAKLRNEHIIPTEFLKYYPKESAFVLWLLSPSPADRPSIDQILQTQLLREYSFVEDETCRSPSSDGYSISAEDMTRLLAQQHELERQKELLQQQQQQIEHYRKLVAEQEKLITQLMKKG